MIMPITVSGAAPRVAHEAETRHPSRSPRAAVVRDRSGRTRSRGDDDVRDRPPNTRTRSRPRGTERGAPASRCARRGGVGIGIRSSSPGSAAARKPRQARHGGGAPGLGRHDDLLRGRDSACGPVRAECRHRRGVRGERGAEWAFLVVARDRRAAHDLSLAASSPSPATRARDTAAPTEGSTAHSVCGTRAFGADAQGCSLRHRLLPPGSSPCRDGPRCATNRPRAAGCARRPPTRLSRQRAAARPRRAGIQRHTATIG